MPRIVPMITGTGVSSRKLRAAGMYGSNGGGPSGCAPTMSGNPCGKALIQCSPLQMRCAIVGLIANQPELALSQPGNDFPARFQLQFGAIFGRHKGGFEVRRNARAALDGDVSPRRGDLQRLV